MAPVAARSAALDRQIETARRNTSQLDALRARTKSDMDVLAEMTRILPPPAWLNLLEITRTQVTLAGETATGRAAAAGHRRLAAVPRIGIRDAARARE